MLNSKFTINKINPSNAMDVFFDQFDKTWAEGNDNVKEFSQIPVEVILNGIDDKDINYKYNSDFFRSDDFKVDHQGTHVLFSGCSNTEGVASNLNDIWSYKLNLKIKNSDGFFNLAKGGWGWQKIINNFMIYVKKYGMPEYYFILMPNVGRFYTWDKKESRWEYVQRYEESTEFISNKRPNYTALTPEEHKEKFINFVMGWKFFEFFCEQNNVKLLWTTWDLAEIENFNQINFKNFFPIYTEDMSKFVKEIRKDGNFKKYDWDKRDGHPGNLYHEYWADSFEKEIKKRGWQID